jgi:hypothetical protein
VVSISMDGLDLGGPCLQSAEAVHSATVFSFQLFSFLVFGVGSAQ